MRAWLTLALLLIATTAHAADPWGDRLRQVFPQAAVVETFDDIRPWIPSTGPGSMTTNLPVHNDGSATAINYYTNSTLNATTTEHAIKDHGDAVTGQACRLGFLPEPIHQGLLGHLGFMFGNGLPTTGFRNMHVFWRLKFPKNVFPTSIDAAQNNRGYYAPSQPYDSKMIPKLASFSHGVTGKDQWNGYNEVTGTQQGPYAVGFPRMPYATFSMVPQLQYGGTYVTNPADPQTARMNWANADMGSETWPGGAGYEAPLGYNKWYTMATGTNGEKQGVATGAWIGIEFRVKLVDDAPGKDELQIWYYTPEGAKTEMVNLADRWLHNIAISAGHAWNFVFFGGNTSNTWLSIDSSMVGSYLIDDVVISNAPIGDAYFAELAAYKSGDTVPVQPANYYVDITNGNDGNDGKTPQTAWKTIAKVNGFDFVPGDVVRFNVGDYGTTTLTPKTSGSAGKPITFASYAAGGAKPIFRGGVSLNGRNYVNIDGLDLTSTGITASLAGATHNVITNCAVYSTASSWSPTISVRNGSHFNEISHNTISQAPANNDIINLRNDADNNLIAYNDITIQGSHAAIDIEGWTLGGEAAVGDHSGNNNIVRGNKITGHNGAGVPITIQANSFENVVDNNVLKGDSTVGDFCYLMYPATQHARTMAMIKGVGERNIIRNNILSNYPCQDAEGLFFDTYVYDGFTNNALYNHIYHNVVTGIGAGATGLYFGVATGGTHNNNVVKNNILFNNGGLTWDTDSDIPVSSDTALFQMRDSLDSNFYDKNIFYTSATSGSVIWLGGNYYSVAQSDTASAKWGTNYQTAPLLDAATFLPQSGSPALNAGSDLTTITSASGTGTFVTVADAWYFTDGNGIAGGDVIEVNNQTATIKNITYGAGLTGTLEVTPAITWTQGMGVNLPFDGTAPPIGLSLGESNVVDPPPVSTATADEGYPKHVLLSASEPAAIYYTLDGTDPRTSPTRNTYTGTPLVISVTTTLTFYAQDTAGNAEYPHSITYNITMPVKPRIPSSKASSRTQLR